MRLQLVGAVQQPHIEAALHERCLQLNKRTSYEKNEEVTLQAKKIDHMNGQSK
jgi:hypothetical protein